MNKELWENITELIDEELADEAAEYFARHGSDTAPQGSEEYGESVAPLKLSAPKKRGVMPYIAVAAAAAAVVLCVIAGGLMLGGNPLLPVNEPHSTEETGETSETDETENGAAVSAELCRQIAELFLESRSEFDDGMMLDTMYVQAETLGGGRALVAITVPTYPDYSTFVYEINGDEVTELAHLFNTSTAEFFTRGDEILVHKIWQTSAYAISAVYYDEYYLTLSESGAQTNIGTVRRAEIDGAQQVYIGSVSSDGAFGDYTEVAYADYLAEKLRLTDGWRFVMGREFSAVADGFRDIGGVDTVTGYILEAFGAEDTLPPDSGSADINEAAAMAIAEDYLPQHHRNHTDATGDTMYVLAARQSADCAMVLMTIPQNDVTVYNTVVYTADGDGVEWADSHFRANRLELYTSDKGILFHSAYIYEDNQYSSCEESFYTLIDGKYICVAELMHANDNGELKNIYIADFSIDTSNGDTNRVESTAEEYYAELARVTEGWTLIDSVRYPQDNAAAEGFQRIGDKEVVAGYITEALRKNDVSTDAVTVPVSLGDISDRVAEMFLEVNSADGDDMLVLAAQAGGKRYVVTLVPHLLRYDAHVFEIDGAAVKHAQYNSLSMSVADGLELYTGGDGILLHHKNWLYDPITQDTEHFDYYYTVKCGALSLLGAVKRIEDENGDTVSYHISDETLPATNGLGYAEAAAAEYADEIAGLTEGWELAQGLALPHDGSATEAFKPIGDKAAVSGYILDALRQSGSAESDGEQNGTTESGGEEIPDPEDGSPEELITYGATVKAETDEEKYAAIARLFLQQSPNADRLMLFNDGYSGCDLYGFAYKEGSYYTLHLFAAGSGVVTHIDTVRNITELDCCRENILHYKLRTVYNGDNAVADIYKKVQYDENGGCFVLNGHGVVIKTLNESGGIKACYITDGVDMGGDFEEVGYAVYYQRQQQYESYVTSAKPTADFEEALYTFPMTQSESALVKYISDYMEYITPLDPGSSKRIDFPDAPELSIGDEVTQPERYSFIWHQEIVTGDPYTRADDVQPSDSGYALLNTLENGVLIKAVYFDGDTERPLEFSDVTSTGGASLGGGSDVGAYKISLPAGTAGRVCSVTVEYSYGQISYCFRIADGTEEEPSETLDSADFVRFGSGMYAPSINSDNCIIDDEGVMLRATYSYSFIDLNDLEYLGEYEQGKFYRTNQYELISVKALDSSYFDSWYDWNFGKKLSETYPKEWCYLVRQWCQLDEYSGAGEFVYEPPELTLTSLDGKQYTVAADGEYKDISIPAGTMLLTTEYGGYADVMSGKGVTYYNGNDGVILQNSDAEYRASIMVGYGADIYYSYNFTVTPTEGDISDAPPMLQILVDGKAETMARGAYSWLDLNGYQNEADAEPPEAPLTVQYGSEVQVLLTGGAQICHVTSLYKLDGEYVSNPGDFARFDADGTLHISPSRINSLIEIYVGFPQGVCYYYFAVADDAGVYETEFIEALQSSIAECSTVSELEGRIKLHDLTSWFERVQVYKDDADLAGGTELTSGVLKAGMVIRVTYNGGKEWITHIT